MPVRVKYEKFERKPLPPIADNIQQILRTAANRICDNSSDKNILLTLSSSISTINQLLASVIKTLEPGLTVALLPPFRKT